MFASDSGLDLSIALGSWPGIASALPGTMALFGGTYELWFWGTLQVGWGGLESRNTAIPCPGAPGGSVSQCWTSIFNNCDPKCLW